jgi:hypothetical protein
VTLILSPPNDRGGYNLLRILKDGRCIGEELEEKKTRSAIGMTRAVSDGSLNVRANPMKT